jgi:hypothetical protein
MKSKWEMKEVGRNEEKLAEDSRYKNFCLTIVGDSSFYRLFRKHS